MWMENSENLYLWKYTKILQRSNIKRGRFGEVEFIEKVIKKRRKYLEKHKFVITKVWSDENIRVQTKKLTKMWNIKEVIQIKRNI